MVIVVAWTHYEYSWVIASQKHWTQLLSSHYLELTGITSAKLVPSNRPLKF